MARSKAQKEPKNQKNRNKNTEEEPLLDFEDVDVSEKQRGSTAKRSGHENSKPALTNTGNDKTEDSKFNYNKSPVSTRTFVNFILSILLSMMYLFW